MSKKLVVNLYGGPGTGKSTTASGVFSLLKTHGVNCEYVSEFAKDLTWEERYKTLGNQPYILGKQYHRLWRIPDSIDVIITDSPIILGNLYNDNEVDKMYAIDLFKRFDNLNYFLNRVKPYNPEGRRQTEEEAKALDIKTKDLLRINNIRFDNANGDYIGTNFITDTILRMLGKKLEYQICKL